ncbi:MSHA biogenesis protein MshA, partial [Vibrio parahaemolyticus]
IGIENFDGGCVRYTEAVNANTPAFSEVITPGKNNVAADACN